MDVARFQAIVERFGGLRIAVIGDFCLDRYLEIDPAKEERSIETGLPVHNVIHVRAQPGGAGTIVNNLSALGIGAILPIGFTGHDGEGFELRRELKRLPGVRITNLVNTSQRQTFTYCKPLLQAPGKSPVELNRLDLKNWTPTPARLEGVLAKHALAAARLVHALIVLDQAAVPQTGVVTQRIRELIKELAATRPELLILADSRSGLRGFPQVTFKMNGAELAALTGAKIGLTLEEIQAEAAALAKHNGRHVFITLAERGIVGAAPNGEVEWVPALPVRGSIDVVGAGDAVSANLAAALASQATLREALEMANAAASVVIHKLGTTGTASVSELGRVLLESAK